MDLAQLIRDIPDWPVEGVLFKDITTLLQDPTAFREALDRLAAPYLDQQIGAQIMALFARLQRELGVTIVVATHDPQVAARAGRVLRLVDGQLAPAAPEVRLRQPALEGSAS